MRERRATLLVLLGATVVVGAWALVAPASFHADFPLDRAWVSLDGPYNEHLVRDVGALNGSLAVVLAWAAHRPTDERVRLAAGATLVYAGPHLLYHATHLSPFGAVDAVAQTVLLALMLLAAASLWRAARREPG